MLVKNGFRLDNLTTTKGTRNFQRVYSLWSENLFVVIIHDSQKQSHGVVLLKRLRLATLLKKRLWQRCFPVNFAKFLRTPFLTEHLRWLLLDSTLNIFLKEFSLVKLEAAIHLRNFLSLSWIFQNNFLFRTLIDHFNVLIQSKNGAFASFFNYRAKQISSKLNHGMCFSKLDQPGGLHWYS